jgi:hypothetical protein
MLGLIVVVWGTGIAMWAIGYWQGHQDRGDR